MSKQSQQNEELFTQHTIRMNAEGKIDGRPAYSDEFKAISESVEDTPLFIRGDEENGYFLTLGGYKVSEKYITLEDVMKDVAHPKWGHILNCISVMIETAFVLATKVKKEEETQPDEEPSQG